LEEIVEEEITGTIILVSSRCLLLDFCRQGWFGFIVLLLALLALAACGGSSQSSSQPPRTAVSITGSTPTVLGVGSNWLFTANQNVTWTLSGAGTLDSNTGLYIAPNTVPSPATVTITATSTSSSSETASAAVTIQSSDPIGTVQSYTQYPGPQSCYSTSVDYGSNYGGQGTCFQLAIECPGTGDLSAYLKVNNPPTTPNGTVLFGVGTGGSGVYDDPTAGGYTDGETTVSNILTSGYTTVQVSFGAPFDNGTQPNGWLTGPGGVRRVACRYATVADWVYNNPSIINPNNVSATNSAPMCATGNSGGSAAIAYAIYEYGMGSEFAMVELTSGPVMTRVDQGCSPCSSSVTGPICPNSTNVATMCYESADAAIVDEAYTSNTSANPPPGPCTDAIAGNPETDASELFLSDSILYAPNEAPVSLPNTIVNQLFGDEDTSNAVPEGMVWEESFAPSSSSPNPRFACLANVQHDIPSFSTGAVQIASDVINLCH
jgi:hypothetical protein